MAISNTQPSFNKKFIHNYYTKKQRKIRSKLNPAAQCITSASSDGSPLRLNTQWHTYWWLTGKYIMLLRTIPQKQIDY